MATLDEIFHYRWINQVVSRLRGPAHRLCQTYGMLPGGPNTNRVGGASVAWDLFDRTRKVPSGSLRGKPPTATAAQVVGHKSANFYRIFEQIPLEYDKVFRKRGIGKALGSVDVMGERYLTKQQAFQSEQFMNNREMLLMFMFKGGFELDVQGDKYTPVPTGSGGAISIDFDLPAENQGAVPKPGSLGSGNVFAGNWQDSANAKVIDELMDLNAVSAHSSRYPQQLGWVNAEGAKHIKEAQQVKDTGGNANIVWANNQTGGANMNFTGRRNDEGSLSNEMSFKLLGYPSITWMIYDDHVLLPNGSTEPFIPEGKALFTPVPGDWAEWAEGSELQLKKPGGRPQEVFGFDMWTEVVAHPVTLNMYAYDCGLPIPYVPKAWYWATIHG